MTRLRTMLFGVLLVGSALSEPLDLSGNFFLQHMVQARQIDEYAAPTYLPPLKKIYCNGPQVCVRKNLCNNGEFTLSFGGAQSQECDPDHEICCTYRPPPPPPPPKPTPPPAQPCHGNDFVCLSPGRCPNGVLPTNDFLTPVYSSKCYAPEICCRVPPPESTALTNDGYVVRVPPNPLPLPSSPPLRVTTNAPIYLPPISYTPDASIQQTTRLPPLRGEDEKSLPIYPNTNTIEEQLPPVGCAAALNCTEPQFCTASGFISKTGPVVLSKDQEIFRVPLTDCRDPERGFTGKCCRDPDYVDPWPVSQLGQYNAQLFGDDGSYKPTQVRAPRPPQPPFRPPVAGPPAPPAPLPSNIVSEQLSLPIFPSPKPVIGQCATRDPSAQPQGPGPYDAAFGEYPWQAMVLLESTKSLLCGGAIIAPDTVATTAACVQGHKPFDVLIKAGEWKLGRDEEPLNFQIARAAKIDIHPSNGMALLRLDAPLNIAPHIAPICVEDSDPTPHDNCVLTGWGKPALAVHAQDAIMHHSPVSILSPDQCASQPDGYRYGPSSTLCGKTAVDACELDYGSALACTNSRGQYVMKGMFVGEDQCGSPNQIASFIKPDVAWIKGGQPSSVNLAYLPPAH